jgi:glutaconate CoA-transferase subunit B
MTYLHPGVDINQAIENTGWDLKVSPNLKTTKAPEQSELEKVRALVSTSDK